MLRMQSVVNLVLGSHGCVGHVGEVNIGNDGELALNRQTVRRDTKEFFVKEQFKFGEFLRSRKRVSSEKFEVRRNLGENGSVDRLELAVAEQFYKSNVGGIQSLSSFN